MTPRETTPRPNLEDVAARAGVSRATVSRVVNGQSSVDPALRHKVEEAVADLGYVPNRAARSLMTRRSDAIALLASEPDYRVFSDPYFSGIIRGISQEVNAAGLQLVLLMAQSAEDLDRAKRYLQSWPVDGVMLISQHAEDDPVPAMLERTGIPYVIGGRPLQRGLTAPYVDNDNVVGASLAARHLVALGRHRLATVAGPGDMSAGVDRLTGFRQTLGADFRPECVEVANFTQSGGDDATERLLRRVPDVDAIFAASDLTAMGVVAALRRHGRRVPEDVAVIGFDDHSFAATCDPPLTTVRQDIVLQGRSMVRMFLAHHRPDLLLAPDPHIPDLARVDHVVLPVRLVVRESA